MMPAAESFFTYFEAERTAVIFVGFLAFVIFLLLFRFLTYNNDQIRASVIDRHRTKLRNNWQRPTRGQLAVKRPRSAALTFRKVVAFLPDRVREEKRTLLRSAGFLADSAPLYFWGVKICSVCIIVVGAAAIFLFDIEDIFFRHLIFGLLFIGLMVFVGTDVFVLWKRRARLRRLGMALPDGLDLLVICSEAGLSLDSSLKRVAEEFVSSVPEFSEELFLTSVEMNFLPDRRQALVNLSQRVDLPAFRGVTSTLIQTEKYGTPLAQALRTLASEFRETRLLKAEEKATRLPAILTVPMICFILPALFLVLTGPAFVQVYRQIGS